MLDINNAKGQLCEVNGQNVSAQGQKKDPKTKMQIRSLKASAWKSHNRVVTHSPETLSALTCHRCCCSVLLFSD